MGSAMAETLLTSDRLRPDRHEGPFEEVDDLENLIWFRPALV